ncbi:MAG: MFS transporter [Pseudomonadota bacterium]
MDDRYAKKWRALVGISLLSFIVFMDYGIVNTILPGIQADLLASVGQLQWVMNVFFMTLAMFMVTMGRLGDIYGRRRVLYIGTAIFGVASAVCGAAPNPEILIAARAVQGTTAAVGLACAASLVTHAFPEEESGRAMGFFMSITAVGMAIGPVIGGFFLSFLSWRWAFYVNIPVIIAGFLVCRGAVPETPRLVAEKIDVWGLAFLIPGIGVMVLAIMQGNTWGWGSGVMIALYAATLVCLVGFVVAEQRVASPIVDFKLFRHPWFISSVFAGLGLGGFIGIGTFMPALYLINIQGMPAYAAGLMLMPITLLVMIIPPAIGKLVDARGPMGFVILGAVILVISACVQIFYLPASPVWFILTGLILFGLGWGFQQASTAVAATSALPPESAGLALGSLWTFWNIASSITLAVGGMILRILDQSRLDASLAANNITLSDHEKHVIRSLLSDPSRAEQTLGELPAKLSTEIAPLFHDSFMDGYSGAMTFLAIWCAVCLIGCVLTAMRGKKPVS